MVGVSHEVVMTRRSSGVTAAGNHGSARYPRSGSEARIQPQSNGSVVHLLGEERGILPLSPAVQVVGLAVQHAHHGEDFLGPTLEHAHRRVQVRLFDMSRPAPSRAEIGTSNPFSRVQAFVMYASAWRTSAPRRPSGYKRTTT